MSLTFLGMPAGPGRAGAPTADAATGAARTGGWRTTGEIPANTLRWGESFPAAAHQTLQNTQLRRNLGHATRTIRNKRAVRV
ncbi:MAG: (4Fe-4S)-binding protein, partial [Actinomyces massiliensis]